MNGQEQAGRGTPRPGRWVRHGALALAVALMVASGGWAESAETAEKTAETTVDPACESADREAGKGLKAFVDADGNVTSEATTELPAPKAATDKPQVVWNKDGQGGRVVWYERSMNASIATVGPDGTVRVRCLPEPVARQALKRHVDKMTGEQADGEAADAEAGAPCEEDGS